MGVEMQPMSVDQLLDALKSGHLSAAILDAWLRAGDAKNLALIALVVALAAVALSVLSLAKLSKITK